MKKWLILSLIANCVIISVLVINNSANSQTENPATPVKKAVAAPAPKLTKEECKALDNKIKGGEYWFNINPNAEAQINDYYNKCSEHTDRHKYSYLSGYYFGIAAMNYAKNNNFPQAIEYMQKALNANIKCQNTPECDTLSFENAIYQELPKYYIQVGDYQNAKKYALLWAETFKKWRGKIGLIHYDLLGDICYELGEIEEATEYYTNVLYEIDYLSTDPRLQDAENAYKFRILREKIYNRVNIVLPSF